VPGLGVSAQFGQQIAADRREQRIVRQDQGIDDL
jgi:hypothetical protein